MAQARRAVSWLAQEARVHAVSSALLFAALLAVHEILLAYARPFSGGEWAYLEVLVLAQCALVTATVASAMSVAPRLARAIAGTALTLPLLFYADALVVQRIDRHLPAVARLLLDASLDDNRRLLDATGIDVRALAGFGAALAAAAATGAWVDARSTRAGRGLLRRTTRARLLAGSIGVAVLLGGLEMLASHVVRSAPWGRFGRSVPQVLGALGPATRAKATLRVTLRARPPVAAAAAALERVEVPADAPPGDVFFFVIESLRADAVGASTAPALAALSADGLRFDAAVAGGNVTQYGWFSLFTSLPALYWQLDPEPGDVAPRGALPLRVARRRGWRVEALTSNDLRYMHLDTSLFGASRELADDFVDESREPGTPASRDEQVVRELERRAQRPHPPTVYVVSLDGTHLPYTWGDGFAPPLRPYADAGHYVRVQVAPEDRRAVVNRYLDAVAFEDALLARFVVVLRSAGAYDDATIVVAGDHGEEFWEHGLASHGSEPCSAQTHAALLLKPSRALRAAGDWSSPKPLASAVDVWPTILDAAGVRGDVSPLLAGASLVRGPAGAAVLASQRYWYRPARFVLDDGRRKVELELRDPDHPTREQDLDVLALRDEDDAPTDEGLTPREYVTLVRERFGRDLDRFFVVRW
jgi:hypothetical protein